MEDNLNKKKILVDFVGLPGSGKSTIASGIIKKILSLDYNYDSRDCLSENPQRSKLNRYIYGLYFIIRHPIFTLRIIYFFSDSKRVYEILKNFISQYRIINKKNNIKVCDQGILNSAFYIENRKINWDFLIKAYSSLLKIEKILIVFVDSDFETAIYRARKRPSKKHFTETMKKEKIEKIFSNYLKNCKNFIDYNYKFQILKLNNKNEIKENVDIIIEKMEDILYKCKQKKQKK